MVLGKRTSISQFQRLSRIELALREIVALNFGPNFLMHLTIRSLRNPDSKLHFTHVRRDQ